MQTNCPRAVSKLKPWNQKGQGKDWTCVQNSFPPGPCKYKVGIVLKNGKKWVIDSVPDHV